MNHTKKARFEFRQRRQMLGYINETSSHKFVIRVEEQEGMVVEVSYYSRGDLSINRMKFIIFDNAKMWSGKQL